MAGRFLSGALAGMMLSLAIASSNARATTFAEMTIDQFTDASTWIVEGRVEEVWTELDSENDLVWTRARVAVHTTHKGPQQATELIIDSAGGRVGNYEVYVPGMATFSVGEEIFVFLSDTGKRIVPVSMFQGKYTVRRATGETRQHVMQWQSRRGETFDARFLPHPPAEYRLYLDDLRADVREHLEQPWDGKPIPGLNLEKLQTINTPERRMPR